MKVIFAIIIVLVTGLSCTSKKPILMANNNTLRCEGYRFDRSIGKSTNVQLTVRSYWCEDNEPIKSGVLLVKNGDDKVVSRADINSEGVATFTLAPGHYSISTRLSGARTPLVLIEAGNYSLTFYIGPGDSTVN